MPAKKSTTRATRKVSPAKVKASPRPARKPASTKNYTDRELVLIDMALAAGAGLGSHGHRLPLAAVEYWAEYFSGTVDAALKAGDDWAKSRKRARQVGETMGQDAAMRLTQISGSKEVTPDEGRAIAHASQQGAISHPSCPKPGGAGKFCQ